MAVLYVSEPGAEVGLRNERIVVRKGKVRLASERVDNLERLVLAGLVQVAQAIRALLEQDVDVVWQNQGGRHLGRLVAQGGRNAELIRQQFERLGDSAAALALARQFVKGKLENQRRLLARQRRVPRTPASVSALVSLRALVERTDRPTYSLTTSSRPSGLRARVNRPSLSYVRPSHAMGALPTRNGALVPTTRPR